jgi:hypothetical protein
VTNEKEIICHGLTAKNKSVVVAAPLLLETLQKIVSIQYDSSASLANLNGAINEAKEVIKKATE